MSSFDLTTRDKVKAYLGITDTDSDAIIDDIVTTVTCEMEIYCNRQFELDTYTEQITGNCENSVRLRNIPIEGILYAATGSASAIRVTYDGSATGFIDVQEKEIRLTELLSQTDIAIADTDTLANVVTKINAESNWSAEINNDDYNAYPGRILTQRTYGVLETTNDVDLVAATNHLALREINDGLYQTSKNLTGNAIVIYNGGYAVDAIPTGLEQLATQISADTYKSISQQANLKGEKIGDYSYTLNTEVKTAMEAYVNRLDFYAEMAL